MKTYLGIELGSTRMKAQLIDEHGNPLASGGYAWENQLVDGLWTYPLDQVWVGLQQTYRELVSNYEKQWEGPPVISAMGFSGMMHGYLPFNRQGELLAPFRTWRNTNTDEAVKILSEAFQFNVPHRWSVGHLYQAMLNGEEHVRDIASLHTLASYVHWKVTGQEVIGVGDASGMFPIDTSTGTYDAEMLRKFTDLASEYSWDIKELLPRVLKAGEAAGVLTEEGALLLDPSGRLPAGIPLCPPEGDAGTGMVATNSVVPRTGNVSAGTSIFGMLVLEHPLTKYYPEIDIVTTPDGADVAMVHCNNCTNEIDAWVGVLDDACKLLGLDVPKYKIYDVFYESANALSESDEPPVVMTNNYLAGEPIVKVDPGAPMMVRIPGTEFGLAEFARSQVDGAVAVLSIGMQLLEQEEGVTVDTLVGHGGFFKTEEVGQRTLSAATGVPVRVMETASEGGAWGMAILAAYLDDAEDRDFGTYLEDVIFGSAKSRTIMATDADLKRYATYLGHYKESLALAQAAGAYGQG